MTCLAGDVNGRHYINEVTPAALPPPPGDMLWKSHCNDAVMTSNHALAPPPGDMAWKSHCNDAVMTSYQLPQHYEYSVVSNALPWPSHVIADHKATHCKTSQRRRNTDRHKDRVIHHTTTYM